MASAVVSESNGVSKIGMGMDYYCNDDYSSVEDNKNLGDDILDDLDSYMDDINDRLMISRMVSDSVIKGMVNAVSQEAAEVVAAKDLEVAGLKEALLRHQRVKLRKDDVYNGIANNNGFVEHDNLRESLCLLNRTAQEQLEKLGKCIAIPKEDNCEEISSATDMGSAFYSLKCTLEAMSQQVHLIPSVHDFKLDHEICDEVETMVLSTIFGSIQEDYERRVWDVNTVLGLVDRFKEISSLRHELESVQKCLIGSEHGHLNPQGSQEIDHFHRKVLSSHGLPSGFLWDRNGKCEESKMTMPETLETSQLKHMSNEELYKHFRTEITRMKRDHESDVQEMTEEYFTLKREFLKEKELLKERGPFATFRKTKDFEMLSKNTSNIILKLDSILVGSDILSEFCNYSREILDNLLIENHKFRDLLNDQKLELCYLSSQASYVTKKLSYHSIAEQRLHILVGHLKNSLEDARIKASIGEEIYKCILRDLASQVKSDHEDLDVKFFFMREIIGIIYEEAVCDAEVVIKSDCVELFDLDSTLMQHICGIVFQEVVKDMEMNFTELKKKCIEGDKSLVFLESMVSKIGKELQAEGEENKKLSHQVLLLENIIRENDKSFIEVTSAFEKEKQQLELVNEERIINLRTQHESLITEKIEELILLKDKLNNCQKQIDLYQIEVSKLMKADEEKTKFISILEQQQENLAMLKEKHKQHRRQMESVVHVIQGLSKSFADFELRTTESIRWHNVRLENSTFQIHSLIPKVNISRRTALLYKERLEKKCSDLQKAESEVDLLGDEVDALLSLLEKIYVALDHYSPILQHYPGIIEILRLVRRELSGEAVKAGPAKLCKRLH